MRNVNLNLYKPFVYIYRCKSVSQAARELHISQPTLSYNMKELERQLGFKLFNPHSRGVEPTADGDRLFKWLLQYMDFVMGVEKSEMPTEDGVDGEGLFLPFVSTQVLSNKESNEMLVQLIKENYRISEKLLTLVG